MLSYLIWTHFHGILGLFGPNGVLCDPISLSIMYELNVTLICD